MNDNHATISLEGALAGYEVVLNLDEITIGFYEYLEAPGWTRTLDALCEVVIGGRLPSGAITVSPEDGKADPKQVRQVLRKLKTDQAMALANGIGAAIKLPKNA